MGHCVTMQDESKKAIVAAYLAEVAHYPARSANQGFYCSAASSLKNEPHVRIWLWTTYRL